MYSFIYISFFNFAFVVVSPPPSEHTLPPSWIAPRSQVRKRYILVDTARSLAELYDARREKPSVLVTSPGSPDLHAQGRGRHSRHPTGNANVGGSIQVKLGFDPMGLQLIVTIICAAGLTPKSNGQPRNPYAKIFLLPDKRWVNANCGSIVSINWEFSIGIRNRSLLNYREAAGQDETKQTEELFMNFWFSVSLKIPT